MVSWLRYVYYTLSWLLSLFFFFFSRICRWKVYFFRSKGNGRKCNDVSHVFRWLQHARKKQKRMKSERRTLIEMISKQVCCLIDRTSFCWSLNFTFLWKQFLNFVADFKILELKLNFKRIQSEAKTVRNVNDEVDK